MRSIDFVTANLGFGAESFRGPGEVEISLSSDAFGLAEPGKAEAADQTYVRHPGQDVAAGFASGRGNASALHFSEG